MATVQKIRSIAGIGLVMLLGMTDRAFAAAGTLTPTAYQTVTTSSGAPIAGACVWTYIAGTTTPVATYTDKALTVANSNPITTDTAGQFVAWLTPGSSYKFTFETACIAPAHGSVLRTVDNIDAVPTSSATVDIVGTAGEALTAGNCAYLSDGSAAKTAGQWFKCDSANTYSSMTPQTGLALATVAAAASVTVRAQGSMTGLSSLSVGSTYYIGTAGALTTTAPANRRLIGQADSATTMVLATDPPIAVTVPVVDDFRLSASSTNCVPAADVTAATTIYFTPCLGSRITLADSSGNLAVFSSAEISIAVPATTSQMYDVWCYNNAGVPALELLAWSTDITRATGIVRTTTGFYTKSGDLTRRYVGSFRTTTVSGQTEDSQAKRYVWNYYNRSRRTLYKTDATASWTYNTAAWRQANGSASNQVDIVVGVAEITLYLTASAIANNSTSNQLVDVGIGEDSTAGTPTGVVGIGFSIGASSSTVGLGFCTMTRTPAVGRHFYAWLEFGPAANTTTWYGSGIGAQGLAGWFEG